MPFLFGGGGTQTSQVVNSTQLPPEMKAYVEGAGEQGLAALQTAVPRLSADNAYVTGQRGIAGLQGDQTAALDMTRGIAQGGNPLTATSLDYANRAAGGEFLNSNPFKDQMLASQAEDAMRGVNSQFASFGRFGSGAHSGTAAREITKAQLPYLSQNYNQERQRQENAINMLPMLDAARFTDAQALAGVGDAYQKQAQAEQDAIYEQQLNADTRGLERDIALANVGAGAGNVANVGGASTRTVTEPSNPVGNIIGGIGAGANIGSLFPGYGTAIGAGLGGLGGLFGSF